MELPMMSGRCKTTDPDRCDLKKLICLHIACHKMTGQYPAQCRVAMIDSMAADKGFRGCYDCGILRYCTYLRGYTKWLRWIVGAVLWYPTSKHERHACAEGLNNPPPKADCYD